MSEITNDIIEVGKKLQRGHKNKIAKKLEISRAAVTRFFKGESVINETSLKILTTAEELLKKENSSEEIQKKATDTVKRILNRK